MKNIHEQIKVQERTNLESLKELTEYMKHPRPWLSKKWNWRSNKWE